MNALTQARKNLGKTMANTANILVVDDHSISRYALKSILTGAGYPTFEAVDGEQAWEVLQNEKIQQI